jgi:uncharacterized iron-regulated protein
MKRTVFAFVALLAVLVFAESRAQDTCPRAGIGQAIEDAWRAQSGNHPLAGVILEGTAPLAPSIDGPCRRSPIERLQRALATHLQEGGIVLLGEVHDNEAQHAFRGALLTAIAAELADSKKQRPALVFEHIRTDQAAALGPPPTPSTQDARELLDRLEWDKSGWPASKLFLPVFQAALAQGLPILPGHPARAEVRDVARKGISALPADTATRLGLDLPLPEALGNALLDELEASHCGLMPRAAFGNMALAQRFRDAHMAAALADAARVHGSAILLAGNGHLRTDRGVPWYLARLAPDRKVLAIALMEVEEGATDATALVPLDPQGRPAADFVVVTPGTSRPDPCEEMRARFKKPG